MINEVLSFDYQIKSDSDSERAYLIACARTNHLIAVFGLFEMFDLKAYENDLPTLELYLKNIGELGSVIASGLLFDIDKIKEVEIKPKKNKFGGESNG